jgi:hypothetical protein
MVIMGTFMTKHSGSALRYGSPMQQREKQKTISEQSYEDELKRERRMPGFAEKPEGGVTRAAKETTSKFKKDISTPKAKTLKKSPVNHGSHRITVNNHKHTKQSSVSNSKTKEYPTGAKFGGNEEAKKLTDAQLKKMRKK